MLKLTVRQLGEMLYDSFEEDSWGTVDPEAFCNPRRSGDDDEFCGLYEVLERVVERINKKFGA